MAMQLEDEEPEQNEIDLIADAHEAILASQIERDGDVDEDTPPRGSLPSPLKREEILE